MTTPPLRALVLVLACTTSACVAEVDPETAWAPLPRAATAVVAHVDVATHGALGVAETHTLEVGEARLAHAAIGRTLALWAVPMRGHFVATVGDDGTVGTPRSISSVYVAPGDPVALAAFGVGFVAAIAHEGCGAGVDVIVLGPNGTIEQSSRPIYSASSSGLPVALATHGSTIYVAHDAQLAIGDGSGWSPGAGFESGEPITSVAVAPDGRVLIASPRGTLRVLDRDGTALSESLSVGLGAGAAWTCGPSCWVAVGTSFTRRITFADGALTTAWVPSLALDDVIGATEGACARVALSRDGVLRRIDANGEALDTPPDAFAFTPGAIDVAMLRAGRFGLLVPRPSVADVNGALQRTAPFEVQLADLDDCAP